MKEISLLELYQLNYNIVNLGIVKRHHTKYEEFNCIGMHKSQNTLFYINGCDVKYLLKDNTEINAPDGSLVYMPVGSEYNLVVHRIKTDNNCTISLNFILQNFANEDFILSRDIMVFDDLNGDYRNLFNNINRYNSVPLVCAGKIKSLVYDVFFHLSEKSWSGNKDKYTIISKGIDYLENDEKQELQIAEIAKLCNVSEVYFRRLFKEYSGTTPSEYRIKNKLSKVKAFLKNTNLTISEIAEHLHFTDASYLAKQFRSSYGMTPFEYREQNIIHYDSKKDYF